MNTKIITRIIYILFIFTIVLNIFSLKVNARSGFYITLSESEVMLQEEFNINIGVTDIYGAAGTIWIFFDNNKVECTSDISDNLNILEDRIIYTWVTENGRNKNLEDILEISFKSKNSSGIASFTVIGEVYDENNNEILLNSASKEILITEKVNNLSDDPNSINLESLRLDTEGIIPDFDPDITVYYLIVDENTEKIGVEAVPISSNAKTSISGNNNLKNGLNEIVINVSNNNKNKEYVINVTKTDNIENANTNLTTLAVENYELIPEYQENITIYNIEISNTDEKLNILAIPENSSANVEIKNNENLNIGENQIEILVTAKNGITKREYILNIYRRSKEEEEEYNREQEKIAEESEAIVEKISNSSGYTNKNTEDISEENQIENLKNNITMWVGILLSILVTVLMIRSIIKQK